MKMNIILRIFSLSLIIGGVSILNGMEKAVEGMGAGKPESKIVPIDADNLKDKTNIVLTAYTVQLGGKIGTLDSLGRVQVWDSESGSLLQTAERGYRGARSLSFSPDGAALIIEEPEGITRIILASLEELQYIAAQNREWINSLVPQANVTFQDKKEKILKRVKDNSGLLEATLDSEGKVQVWKVSSGALLKTVKGSYKDENVRYLDFTPNGRSVLIITSTTTYRVPLS